ncbi:hypothetical protein IAD21_02825 [Abditibacteriota bacterium]|nr:hypothetical protein IAD21_02825 [Abditibacteriota bacterium]
MFKIGFAWVYLVFQFLNIGTNLICLHLQIFAPVKVLLL